MLIGFSDGDCSRVAFGARRDHFNWGEPTATACKHANIAAFRMEIVPGLPSAHDLAEFLNLRSFRQLITY